MSGYVQLEAENGERGSRHPRHVWALCCCALGAGALIAVSQSANKDQSYSDTLAQKPSSWHQSGPQAINGRASLHPLVSMRLPLHLDASLSHWTANAPQTLRGSHVARAGDDEATKVPKDKSKMKVAVTGAEPGPVAAWPLKYLTIIEKGLKQVDAEQALQMIQEEDAVLVDVRPEEEFTAETAEGAVGVPLFVPRGGDGLGNKFKNALAFALGVKSREQNPKFADLANKALPKDKPVIIICNRGGTLDATRTNSFGTAAQLADVDQYTHSFQAAWELFEAGFDKLYYVQGGLSRWKSGGLPLTVKE
eukprot:gnl/TRDRNA2_/TRDRNA2_198143_c0_seq1.p1 gnl/TRDRNA2_/TRDRNA2_198143_c0~~gnl/TRDRNA2_/TRDRNA2_198143_c0_seq1.p1  ORF type:complete len:307 (+),score=48.69 gnl/TRDRNA2_/TRDRNA2_198143_c0_seq1:44-964(+)